MRNLVAALLCIVIAVPLAARGDTPPPSPTPTESQLVEHDSYINKDGVRVHSPAHTKNGHAPAGASAQCRDGTFSFSQHHQGTCSHHGGVSHWLN
jgi:hypothetical protein